MSATGTTTPRGTADAPAGQPGHHGHPGWLAHHFDTPEQQFQSGKLGMWLFLATEILLFGGLFCAYAIYRAHHPEVFFYAHHFLDKKLGALNTLVLITSSFTMAWAVHAAQRGQKRLLIALLSLTLAGGFTFMAVKKVEYEQKWEHGLLWGKKYRSPEHAAHGETHGGEAAGDAGAAAPAEGGAAGHAPAPAVPEVAAPGGESAEAAPPAERSQLPPAAAGPQGLAPESPAGGHGPEPRNVQIFFGIYFAMTGLHGIHVLAGMIAIAWVLARSAKGQFGPDYFTPVDLVGLYWHLVDLIWIFLFPLLYLIT